MLNITMRKLYISRLLLFFIAISIFSNVITITSCTTDKPPTENDDDNPKCNLNKRIIGLCYGPHRDNEDPDYGIQPTIKEISEDLLFIKKLTSTIRTYGAADNLEQIPILCEQHSIDCYPGAWISRFECENERQIDNLINIANQNLSCVKGLIVGNEVMLRKDITEQQLLEYISKVDSATNLSITTAETWKDWLDHPQLAEAVDVLFVHIYPYWDEISVEEGANYILEKWNKLKAKYPNKKMVIGETGWPSQGEIRGNAVPGPENQKRFYSDFIVMAEANDIDYFYFEIFDEKWKGKFEGEAGSNWGIFSSDGALKPHFSDLFPDFAQNGINRPPRVVYSTKETLPLYVYKDGCSPLNGFFSSGWMGELATLVKPDTLVEPVEIIDELCTDYPYSGETCIQITYTPSPGEWGGIYWQFPVNNWGQYPGYDLYNSVMGCDTIKFSFWVRGKSGGEKAEFKTGGLGNFESNYQDSYGPFSNGVITLTKQWEKYTIDLTGSDLSMIIGGFSWVTNHEQNPNGCTIYLDDIMFECITSGN